MGQDCSEISSSKTYQQDSSEISTFIHDEEDCSEISSAKTYQQDCSEKPAFISRIARKFLVPNPRFIRNGMVPETHSF